jgi:hypothetical protein
MNPKLKTLEALESCYQHTFNVEDEATFTEALALAETLKQIDTIDYETLLEEAKALVLLNWRLSQRSLVGTFINGNIFRILLEAETIIGHLYSIRKEQYRHTVLEIKSSLLDRILDATAYELGEFLDEFELSDFEEDKKNAFLNCDPRETIVTVIELCSMLRELDADLDGTPIELLVREKEINE